MPKLIASDESISGAPMHPVRPSNINIGEHFWDAFGNSETESSAYWIVRLMQEAGDLWRPFSNQEIETLYRKAGHGGYRFNRLKDGEYGWILERDGLNYITHNFICRCYEVAPVQPKGN